MGMESRLASRRLVINILSLRSSLAGPGKRPRAGAGELACELLTDQFYKEAILSFLQIVTQEKKLMGENLAFQ